MLQKRSVKRPLASLAVFVIGVAIMRLTYGTAPGVPGNDSFYHVKMAAMLPQHGLLHELPWLRFTYFTEEGHAFIGHHYGFHALLAPFVHLSHWLTGDYLPGARWAMATFFGLSLMLFDMVLLTARVRWRWLWLILFVLMPFQFFTRHAYVRAISPSLALMLLVVLLMLRRRYALTGVAIAGYIHLYLGGVLYAPLLVGLYAISLLLGPRDDRSVPSRLALWAAAGWIVGVLTHPYSHGIWEFMNLQVFGSGLSPDISVGREWKPYEGLWWFAQMSGTVLTVWAIAVCLRLRLGKPATAHELMLLTAHLVFLGLTFKARRFIEYWPVFCLLSSAYLTAPVIERWAKWCDHLVDPRECGIALWVRRATAGVLVLVVFVIVCATPLWGEIRRTAACKYDLPAIREAMAFLQQYSEPGDVVFTDDWDIFPVFFYHNSHNYYIVGLDPKFTHARRPVLWERYVKVSRGQVPVDVSVEFGEERAEKINVALQDIRDRFGAKFVITDLDHRTLAAQLATDEDLAELVYPAKSYEEVRNAPYLIFRIHERP